MEIISIDTGRPLAQGLTVNASTAHHAAVGFNSATGFSSPNPKGGRPLDSGFFASVTPFVRLQWADRVGSRKARRFPLGRSANPLGSAHPFSSGCGNITATKGGHYHG